MAIIKTANGHQTSLLVSQHIPDFVRSDHPKFVTFIEKYYEFLANNSLMQTSDGTNYYGADYASKAISDIHDIDTTDIDLFVESFQKQYAVNFPRSVYNTEDTRILYKNILDFYRAVGTEDSFKMLFRLIYNEDIEIYYPKEDMLIASGGNYVQQVRVKLRHVDDLNNIENAKIVGKTSGAYGTVETIDVLPPQSISYVPGKIGKTSSTYNSGQANTEIYDSNRLLEKTGREAYAYLTNQHGTFDIFEEVYYVKDNETVTTVSNTTILPVTTNMVLSDTYDYAFANSVVSFDDGRHYKSSNSQYVPWGTANIGFANTGLWHTTGTGQGQIQVYPDPTVTSSFLTQPVLRIGNNCGATGGGTASATGDLRQLVYSRNIPIYSDDTIYKLSITARDVGGNSALSIAEGNKFSAGVVCIRHDLDRIDSTYNDTYDNPFWFASHQQAIDDNFFTYTAYFKGRQTAQNLNTVYPSTKYGSGGRVDLTSGTRYYNSIQNAINGETLLPFNTTWFKPAIKVNEPNGASYSQGVTEIKLVQVEEIGSMQSNFEKGAGEYRDESSLLSTKGAHLQDGYYRQLYAYDIRSQQQMEDYNTVVRKTAHPAGLKMFGTKITETQADSIWTTATATTNLTETFSPDTIDSLAGWWKADELGPVNIEWKKFTPDATNVSNGIFGTNTNRMTAGGSLFEDRDADYLSRISPPLTDEVIDTIQVEYSGLSAPPVGGSRSLKLTDTHTDSVPQVLLGPQVSLSGYKRQQNYDDHSFGVVLDPGKKWLVSCYAMTSNLISDVSGMNSFRFNFHSSNTSGYSGSNKISGMVEPFTEVNTWERKANTIDMSSGAHINTTRTFLKFIFADRSSFTQATGNTYYLIDGIMIEEYIPETHGAQAPYTPSPYVRPGLNGSNVLSWYDQSVNEHHVYANTHGGKFYTPQFIANAVNGNPAVRFSANTVKNTGNVYQYSSIGGTANSYALEHGDATNFKPPTSGLQATKTLAASSLAKPVANTWTIMAVVKTNLAINSTSYDATLNPTIFNSGYGGNKNSLDSGAGSITGTMHLGYDVIDETGAVLTNVVNSTAGIISTNTAAITDFGDTLSSANTTQFRIVGMSINASSLSGSSVTDLLNFHIDGRRFANSEINNTLSDMSYTGMHGISQNAYVTSIGKWAPSNNKIWDTSATGVNNLYQYGAADWDGDIAEILVFNEKLTNTNIAFVEGYLAHKYSLQENLLHKDGSSAANTYAYKWDFANTEDGWTKDTGTFTKHAANLQFTGTSTGASGHFIYTNFPSEPIDGSGFQSIKIRFWRQDNPGTDQEQWSGKIRWTTTRSGEDSFETGSNSQRSVQFDASEPADTTNFYDHYVVPATLTADTNNWANSMITGLKLEFSTGVDSTVDYYIDEISVYDATRTHHPFRYDAPTNVRGYANSWYRDY